ncbi:MAG TPA: hypothetical protein VFH54_07555 [Mycobacteriales bacterium]|nr:hypothetical protein [Mycobacteriales bacterium]
MLQHALEDAGSGPVGGPVRVHHLARAVMRMIEVHQPELSTKLGSEQIGVLRQLALDVAEAADASGEPGVSEDDQTEGLRDIAKSLSSIASALEKIADTLRRREDKGAQPRPSLEERLTTQIAQVLANSDDSALVSVTPWDSNSSQPLSALQFLTQLLRSGS